MLTDDFSFVRAARASAVDGDEFDFAQHNMKKGNNNTTYVLLYVEHVPRDIAPYDGWFATFESVKTSKKT